MANVESEVLMIWMGSILLGGGIGLLVYGVVRWWPVRRASGGWEAKVERGAVLSICHTIGRTLQSYFPDWFASREGKDRITLMKAGLFPGVEPCDLAGMHLFGAVLGMACGWVLFPDKATTGAMGGAVLGLVFPFWWVRKRIRERQAELSREFPFALDILTLAVGGGLDFTASMREIVNNMDSGPVFEEFSSVINDIDTGVSRSDALRRFAERVDVVEIRSAILGLIQSIEMGSELVETLRRQAEQLRYNRLMKAEEAAAKAPTKMMIPMVLFILPCVFIVIFAPIAISMIQTFRGF